MKRLVRHVRRLKKGTATAHTLAVDPITFVADRLLGAIVQTFIPVPFVGELIVYFKKPILAMLASLAIVLVMFVLLGVALVVNPAMLFFFPGKANTQINVVPIESLNGYLESGFSDTDTPSRDPFGGEGMLNSQITAYFHDANYFLTYHLVHEGIDLVPSNEYYTRNQAYKLAGVVVMFATISGTARDYIDSLGALTVDITNAQGTLLVEYKHLKQFIMQPGSVQAGQPVGVMGETGFAFGEHLHYQIEVNQGGTWISVNPLNYLP